MVGLGVSLQVALVYGTLTLVSLYTAYNHNDSSGNQGSTLLSIISLQSTDGSSVAYSSIKLCDGLKMRDTHLCSSKWSQSVFYPKVFMIHNYRKWMRTHIP